ncbi:Three-deoxy-D-manno-octulosonic-acid transferase domain protein [Thioalkalivibrio sulfidiphilus HL-EbGr7]|uniref:3-deoxy-D-manno-octulosonic acid transferase n=1 Tax=Thioalkalivibrio sulfidiphilus (strain HL-EbGR7) TaxID=396588 RepID=B8GL60_THISH|nr:lipid IV(A) 3-deoxy-D-manno-octulosonic acid transferase [Thioalkalivibrio sulfidiphilus]ACL71578.1 Three-deoxy-D-manno-octulosonic-acid transferase domain protein [Thioalkalivibrio sulfidiphilus HL-EbGr7]
MWRALYSLLLYLLWPLVAMRLLWRARRNPEYRRRWGERFAVGPRLDAAPRLWVHAVSVGEVVAAVPLVRALMARFPDHRILVTTTTPTGSAELRRRLGETVEHRYLPLDLPHLMRGLVRAVRPRLLVVMETELWPNLFAACRRQGVPVMLVNGRLSARSFQGYRRIRPLVAEALGAVTALAARSEEDAERFIGLGARPERVRVTGNLKYDLELPAGGEGIKPLTRPAWIAASTHEGEDARLLAVHGRILERVPDALLILVPRHPERFEAVAELCRAVGMPAARRSRGERPGPATRVWLGDTMGELPELFPLARVAFMGGSLVPTGGHNPLEAAAHGLPVLTGPHVFNFREVFDALVQAGGAEVVGDEASLAERLIALLNDEAERSRRGEAAARVVQENRGAVARVVDWVGQVASG